MLYQGFCPKRTVPTEANGPDPMWTLIYIGVETGLQRSSVSPIVWTVPWSLHGERPPTFLQKSSWLWSSKDRPFLFDRLVSLKRPSNSTVHFELDCFETVNNGIFQGVIEGKILADHLKWVKLANDETKRTLIVSNCDLTSFKIFKNLFTEISNHRWIRGSVNESKHFFRQWCGTTLGVQPRVIARKL